LTHRFIGVKLSSARAARRGVEMARTIEATVIAGRLAKPAESP
jgi:hypothetical protein